MKSFLRSTLLLTTLLLSLVTNSQYANAAENKVVNLDVPGMTCNFCPITIRIALNKIDGVIEATSDFETKTATVTFDPTKTSIEALTQATAKAGYPSSVKQ